MDTQYMYDTLVAHHKEHHAREELLEARLQAMKKDVQKAKEVLKPHYTFDNNGTGINHAYNLLCRALEGDE